MIVKEGDNLDIKCVPSSETVAVQWTIPITASVDDSTVVQYHTSPHHTITLRNANINHQGVYTCGVLGDEQNIITSVNASVKVLESKPSVDALFMPFFSVIIIY